MVGHHLIIYRYVGHTLAQLRPIPVLSVRQGA